MKSHQCFVVAILVALPLVFVIGEENGTSNEIDDLEMTTPAVEDGVTQSGDLETETLATTTELEYLHYEYDHLDRETFWKNNTHECIDGKVVPSPYLRMKYGQCERIHRKHNPLCTHNCEMAITMLYGPKMIPTIELHTQYFEITMPENLKQDIIEHYKHCFEDFGQNEKDFLDWNCEKPQPFFACIDEFKARMVC